MIDWQGKYFTLILNFAKDPPPPPLSNSTAVIATVCEPRWRSWTDN
jgi:hypothetical protein